MPSSPGRVARGCLFVAAVAGWLGTTPGARGQPSGPPKAYPSAAEVARLLRAEPITTRNWPVWRQRLIDWESDPGDNTTAAFDAAAAFARGQATGKGELPGVMARDAFAWALLGNSYLADDTSSRPTRLASLARAERASRRSVALDPTRAREHARLAGVLTATHVASRSGNGPAPQASYLTEAHTEIETARRLDPGLDSLPYYEGHLALAEDRYPEAAAHLRPYVAKFPTHQAGVRALAHATVLEGEDRSARIRPLMETFPADGVLVTFHALALAHEGDPLGAVRELDRACALGTNPAHVISAPVVTELRDNAVHVWIGRADRVYRGFVGVYAVVLGLMMSAGLVLAAWTRGDGALKLLGTGTEEWVSAGRVARTGAESLVARVYAYALALGLVLFYAALPFVAVGVVGITAMFACAFLRLDPVPVQPLTAVLFVGVVITWGLVRSLLARPPAGAFGRRKTAADCPRLHAALVEVAERVDTDPVSDVYLAPGAGVGVHQEGRGPFGVFGVKRRVLTLGLSTVNCLTVEQLRAVLAHEYAHFSHRDTFYNRFVYQVSLTIDRAIDGLGQAGRLFKYTNPFYWFLRLYQKAFHLLAAGFSRSREFLADRMAASLYGADEFSAALRAVSTEGSLFEMTVYANVATLLDKRQVYVNIYEAFRQYRDERLTAAERERIYKKLLEGKSSLFASHPTFRERIEAVAGLPEARDPDTRPARELFERPDEIEREMTEFLTAYVVAVRHLRAKGG